MPSEVCYNSIGGIEMNVIRQLKKGRHFTKRIKHPAETQSTIN